MQADDFQKFHDGIAFCSRSERPQYPPTLIGIAAAHNNLKGFRNDPLLLIGNEQLAKQVLHGGTDQPALGLKRMSDGLEEAIEEVLHSRNGQTRHERKAG